MVDKQRSKGFLKAHRKRKRFFLALAKRSTESADVYWDKLLAEADALAALGTDIQRRLEAVSDTLIYGEHGNGPQRSSMDARTDH